MSRLALLSRSRHSENWDPLQSRDLSERAAESETMAKAPVSATSAAAENVKAFIAGGVGGVYAVLVGSWARCDLSSRFSRV